MNRINLSTAVAAAACAAILSQGCSGNGGADADSSAQAIAGIRVRTQQPVARAFEDSLAIQGTIEARNTAAVSARVPGNLDSIWVDEGDSVVAGETPLFQIDPVNLSNQVTIAEQTLAVAKSNLSVSEANFGRIQAEADKAERDFARYARLHDEGKVTDNEFEQRETQRLQAEAAIAVGRAQIELSKQQVDQADAQLVIARKTLADSLIVAPLTGTVSSRSAEPGEFIAAGMPILRIVDTADLEAAAYLPARYFPRVAPGKTPFRLSESGRDIGSFTITYKSPVVNTTLRTFEIKGRIDAGSATSLAPGMMVELAVVLDSRDGIGVPSDAILSRGGRDVVFVADNGKASLRPVSTGLTNDGITEIIDGLDPSDEVIVEGHTLVADGAAINR